MKFAHIADSHLGSWRQPSLQYLNLRAFEKTIDKCIEEKVNFILVVGDIFDTAVPSIEILKAVAAKLRELKEKEIPIYVIPGSHDYSISGKSMISVLDKAGLCIDLSQKKELIQGNVLLFGLAGRKGGLEQQEIIALKEYFARLREKISILKKEKNIFSTILLHTSVIELLPKSLAKEIKALSVKDLPQGFDYYALGHIHLSKIIKQKEGIFAYPGSLFPCNFSELERQHTANFLIIEKNANEKLKITESSIKLKNIINLRIDANNETPITLKEKILKEFKKNNLRDSIVTLRIEGVLKEGKPSELDLINIDEKAKELGAFCFLRNISNFSSKEYEMDLKQVPEIKSIEELEKISILAALEKGIIKEENEEQFKLFLDVLNIEKLEGETTSDFSSKLIKELIKNLKIEEIWK